MFRRTLVNSFKWDSPVGLNSYVELGTLYEQSSLKFLKQLKMDLNHVGGRGDCGIDLEGYWNLSSEHRPRILVQCKRISKQASPSFIREFEGSLLGDSHGNSERVGIFLSTTGPTESCRRRLTMSSLSIIYLHTVEAESSLVLHGFYSSHIFKRKFPFINAFKMKSLNGQRECLSLYNHDTLLCLSKTNEGS